MQPFFKEYLDLLEDCHNSILKALDGLPPTALDWVPGPEMNSISVLLFHLTGAEQFWIGDVAMQESSNRDRDAEFRVQDMDADVLRKRLSDTLEYAQRALDTMSLQDLESSRPSPRDGRNVMVAWALLHALEHATLHLGQIQLTRQLWEQSGKGGRPSAPTL